MRPAITDGFFGGSFMKVRMVALIGALLFVLSACAMPVMVPVNPSNPYRSVAVLPMYNATNDIDGPRMVRELIEKRISRIHYASKPITEVDQILRDRMSLTLGSQLDLTTPQKLGEALGVDAVIYGYLLNFETVTAGVYNVKKVRAGFKMVDTKTGRAVWARGQGVKSDSSSGGLVGAGAKALRDAQDKKEGLEPFKTIPGITGIPMITDWHKLSSQQEKSVKDAAIMSLGEKLVTKALGMHLKPESESMLNFIMGDFPIGPGSGVVVASAPPFAMPKVEMEMPGFGVPAYMDYGDRDFTADIIMTTSVKGEREFRSTGRLARKGTSFRNDMDMTDAFKGESGSMPPKLSKMTFIEKGSEKKSYVLYPEMKKYLENRYAGRVDGKAPRIDKQKVGEEVIDGHKTVKYRVTYTDEQSGAHTGLIWEARDLQNFVIRAEFEEKDALMVMEFKNVRLVSPPASLFNIPQDFVKSGNMMELMMEGGQPDTGEQK